MFKFNNVIRGLEGGYIAVVDKKSPKREKLQVAEFSQDTRNILGLEGHSGEPTIPLVNRLDWDESSVDYPGRHKMHVFVLVLNDVMVGYIAVRWHWNIYQNGKLVNAMGELVEPSSQLMVRPLTEFLAVPLEDKVKPLEGWGIEGICILPKWQRQGLGKLLLMTALEYLGTNEREVAYDPPFTEAGKALIRSLGLSQEEIKLSPGI
jgi:GNAT superfamily N-acetyltransferase